MTSTVSSATSATFRPNVVLVTGVSGWLGSRLAARLGADDRIERVIGVDSSAPRPADLAGFGRTEFVRADIRNPLIGTVLAQARIDTVVHPAPASPTRPQVPVHSAHVAAATSLLSAVEESTTVRRLVHISNAAVYGGGHRDPSVFSESSHPSGVLSRGTARNSAAIEARVRAVVRSRGDIGTTLLRFAPLVGATVDTWLTRYLSLPVVPTPLGFDPRLQVLHEDDAVAAVVAAATEDAALRSAVFNVAGAGTVPLSQALRLGKRAAAPVFVLRRAFGVLTAIADIAGVYSEASDYLRYGRVLDVTALERRFGPVVTRSTVAGLQDFYADAVSLPSLSALAAVAVGAAEQALGRAPVPARQAVTEVMS